MDSGLVPFSRSTNGYGLGDEIFSRDLSQYIAISNGLEFSGAPLNMDLNFAENRFATSDSCSSSYALSSDMTMDGGSPSDDNDFSETVLKYISQMLLEEDMEEKPCMFLDPLALQAAEKSFYDVIGEKYPSEQNQWQSHGDRGLQNDDVDRVRRNTLPSSFMSTPLPKDFVFQSMATKASEIGMRGNCGFGKVEVPNLSWESEFALQFEKGVAEAIKFLPKNNSHLYFDLNANAKIEATKEIISNEAAIEKEEAEEQLHNLLGVKKNHERENDDLERERRNKQSAIYIDEIEEITDMFDNLVCARARCEPGEEGKGAELSKVLVLQQGGPAKAPTSRGKTRGKRQGGKKEVIDLRTLLILCAQAVSSDDCRTANELLKQIKTHSSPFGDGCQRLAHCFANALEARLAGTGAQIYVALSSGRTSAAAMLKAYQAYISACPFTKLAIIFANRSIMSVSQGARTLHIIDFGILYGFQWPALIYHLSKRSGGPPKLRITGIELPQSGFRPAERVEETGRRLAKYCERHNVEFEYRAIAQKWETIQLRHIEINPDEEVVAVNCLFRFKNLLDETVAVNNPRTTVLSLIRKMNPDIFIQAIVNGSYNAPFFVTRFRESLFHFSALFDMMNTNMPDDDDMRLKYEQEFYGREAMNIIACEAAERVERPETYKQWQLRNTRAGFKQLPLDPLLMSKLKAKVRDAYHHDFTVDQDGRWMLQGWKGRILYASSAWTPH